MLAVRRWSGGGSTYQEDNGEEEDEVCQGYGRRPRGEVDLLRLIREAFVDVLPRSAKMLVYHFGGVAAVTA